MTLLYRRYLRRRYQFLLFMLAGAFNTGCGCAVYTIFIFLEFDFNLAILISIFLGIFVAAVVYGEKIVFIGGMFHICIGNYLIGFSPILGVALPSYFL